MKTKITKDMKIGEILQKFPQTIDVFYKYNLSCVGCAIAQLENLESAAKGHRIDLKKFLDDLNKAAKIK